MCPLYCPPLHVPLKVAREKRFPFFMSRATHPTPLSLLCFSQTKPNKQTNRKQPFFYGLVFRYLFVHDFFFFFGDCVLTVHSYYRPTSVVNNETSCQFSFLRDTPSLSHCAPPPFIFIAVL